MTRTLVYAALLILATHPAFAQTLGGASIGLTELAEQVLEEAAEFGIWAAGIGIIVLGASIAAGYSIERVGQLLVGGSVLAGGALFSTAILGAELVR